MEVLYIDEHILIRKIIHLPQKDCLYVSFVFIIGIKNVVSRQYNFCVHFTLRLRW